MVRCQAPRSLKLTGLARDRVPVAVGTAVVAMATVAHVRAVVAMAVVVAPAAVVGLVAVAGPVAAVAATAGSTRFVSN